MNLPPAPTGLQGRFFGNSGGSTSRYYWVQAIYPGMRSLFAGPLLVTTPASLDSNNVVELNWNPTPGAIAYDVVETPTTATPTTGTIGLAVGHTYNALKSFGQALASYTATYFSGGVSIAHARYSFAVDGGTAGAITLVTSDTIPAGSFLIGGVANVIAACTGTAGATGAFGTTAGSSASSLLGTTNITSLTLNASLALACATTPVKMSAAGTITITIATHDFTAGIVDVFVSYVLP